MYPFDMLEVDIPGHGHIMLKYLLLDLNGTIQVDGKIHPGVPAMLESLKGTFDRVLIVSADTRGNLGSLAEELGVDEYRLPGIKPEPVEKVEFVRKVGAEHVAYLGNGNNDRLALQEARLGIAIVGPEGASRSAILAADVLVTNPVDGLGILVDPVKLVATIRE
ncbi:MAG: HAD family hydrolase [Promethearchaeota archaeon]